MDGLTVRFQSHKCRACGKRSCCFMALNYQSEDGQNTAEWVANQVRLVIEDLIANNIAVSSFVADNEPTNGAVHRILVDHFSWLVHVGCANHVIQLVVNEVLALPWLAQMREAVRMILTVFNRTKEHRQALKAIRLGLFPDKPAVRLLMIVETRWSSDYYAMVRIFRLEQAIAVVSPVNLINCLTAF